MCDENLIWQPQKKSLLLKTRVLNVCELESISPENQLGKFIVLDSCQWVIVIPEIDGNFIMVKQWRHGLGGISVEFPGGVVNDGEDVENGAKRELLEETGYSTKSLVKLAEMNPNPAIMSNRVHIFLADKLEKSGAQNLDEDEFVHTKKIPKEIVIQNMGRGQYCHSMMAAALCAYLTQKK